MRLVVVLVLIAAFWPVSAWDFMLVAGVVHRDWWHLVPPMGVGAAFALGGLTTLFAILCGIITFILRALAEDS